MGGETAKERRRLKRLQALNEGNNKASQVPSKSSPASTTPAAKANETRNGALAKPNPGASKRITARSASWKNGLNDARTTLNTAGKRKSSYGNNEQNKMSQHQNKFQKSKAGQKQRPPSKNNVSGTTNRNKDGNAKIQFKGKFTSNPKQPSKKAHKEIKHKIKKPKHLKRKMEHLSKAIAEGAVPSNNESGVGGNNLEELEEQMKNLAEQMKELKKLKEGKASSRKCKDGKNDKSSNFDGTGTRSDNDDEEKQEECMASKDLANGVREYLGGDDDDHDENDNDSSSSSSTSSSSKSTDKNATADEKQIEPPSSNSSSSSPSSNDSDSSEGEKGDEVIDASNTRSRGKRRRGRRDRDTKKDKNDESMKEEPSKTICDEPKNFVSNESNGNTQPMNEINDNIEEAESSSKKTSKKDDKRRCIGRKPVTDYTVGRKYSGKVIYIKPKLGAFIDIGSHSDAFCHISCISDEYAKNVNDVVKIDDEVDARVIEINREKKRITVSLRSDAMAQKEMEMVDARRGREEGVKTSGAKKSGKYANSSAGHFRFDATNGNANLDATNVTSESPENEDLKTERKLARRAERRAQEDRPSGHGRGLVELSTFIHQPGNSNQTNNISNGQKSAADLKRERKLARRAERRALVEGNGAQ
ncbi:hypothetical protein ACHAXS_011781 [Conticribra weissflogii]